MITRRLVAAAILVLLIAAPTALAADSRHRAVTPCPPTAQQIVEKFDSAALAYAFAASQCDTRLVMRVDQPAVHYVVVVGGNAPGVWISPSFGFQVASPLEFQVANDAGGLIGGFTESGGNAQLYSTGFAGITLAPAVGVVNISGGSLYVDMKRVVGRQQQPIADADGSVDDLMKKFNLLLAAIRAHGLIAK